MQLSKIKSFFIASLAIHLFTFNVAFADVQPSIKIAVLKFGTVNWTLETIKQQQLDKKNGFELIVQPLASTQATKISLQADATDMIVSDWTWVARQRGKFSNFLFSPYSSSAGSIMVPSDSPIQSLADLSGRKLGIAGGALDKNWLLLRALALQNNINLNQQVDKVFGAPPLLNHLIQQGELDALSNYWHYSARLKAKGYRKLIGTHDIIHQLGFESTVPILGYVFRETWALAHSSSLNNFLKASKQAAELLCSSDEHWNAILPLTRTDDLKTQSLLRSGYCEGRLTSFTQQDKQTIADIYAILGRIGGDKLVGSVKQLDLNIFWNNNRN